MTGPRFKNPCQYASGDHRVPCHYILSTKEGDVWYCALAFQEGFFSIRADERARCGRRVYLHRVLPESDPELLAAYVAVQLKGLIK